MEKGSKLKQLYISFATQEQRPTHN